MRILEIKFERDRNLENYLRVWDFKYMNKWISKWMK